MKPAVVADVGNSRIKWGLCLDGAVRVICSLPPDDPAAWRKQLESWTEARGSWIVTGVHPSRREQLAEWLRQRGRDVRLLDDPAQLPLRVLLARPDQVGMDRLFDAVAANSRRTQGVPAAIVDAGSAITVDLLNESGAFAGGAILPGLELMAKALHDYTALLPLVVPTKRPAAVPGTATRSAIEVGVFWAAAGGVEAILREYLRHCGSRLEVFLTGGNGPMLQSALPEAHSWPTMTLEGIRLSAEALP